MLNVHAIMRRSLANGPGVRTVVWFQGCSLRCPGCFNPLTHSTEPRILIEPAELAARLARDEGGIEGITISGGEPLEQSAGLLELVSAVRRETNLSIILFSGYTMREIEAMDDGREILSCVDVLVDGRYEGDRRRAAGLRGSSNKTIRLLTGRYGIDDIEATPAAEIIIDQRGRISVSGISPPETSVPTRRADTPGRAQ